MVGYETLKESLQKIKEQHEKVSGGLTEESITIGYAITAIDELQQSVSRYESLCEGWATTAMHLQQMIGEMYDERND